MKNPAARAGFKMDENQEVGSCTLLWDCRMTSAVSPAIQGCSTRQ